MRIIAPANQAITVRNRSLRGAVLDDFSLSDDNNTGLMSVGGIDIDGDGIPDKITHGKSCFLNI